MASRSTQQERPRQPPLEWDRGDPSDPGRLFVDVDVVICEDLDLILERMSANVSRGLPDSKSVLATMIKGIIAVNKGEPDKLLMTRIVECMPRGVGPAEVLALARWENLDHDLRQRLDDPGVPLSVLVPVVKARSDERHALLSQLLAGRAVKSVSAATRAANKARDSRDPWARRMSPRQIERLTDAVSLGSVEKDLAEVRFHTKRRDLASAAFALGMRVAMNHGAKDIVDGLPAHLADLIREARQKGRKA